MATWGWSCLAAGGAGASQPVSPSLQQIDVRRGKQHSSPDGGEVNRGHTQGGREGQGGAGPDWVGRGRAPGQARRLAAGSVHGPIGGRPAPPRGAARRVHVLPPQPAQRCRVLHVGAACAWLSLARGGAVFPFPAACFGFPGQEVFPRRHGSGHAL